MLKQKCQNATLALLSKRGQLIYQVAKGGERYQPGGELDGSVDTQERIFTTGVCTPKISKGNLVGYTRVLGTIILRRNTI